MSISEIEICSITGGTYSVIATSLATGMTGQALSLHQIEATFTQGTHPSISETQAAKRLNALPSFKKNIATTRTLRTYKFSSTDLRATLLASNIDWIY